MIYVVANTKGGTGKTTLAVHLAVWLARTGKCLLIDTDKQASAASWASWRRDLVLEYNPNTVILLNDAVYKEGRAIIPDYDDAVIDAGGRDNAGMRYALTLADILIVPISHSDLDTSAWTDMAEIIRLAVPNNPKLKTCVALNRIDPRRRPPKDIYEFMEEQGIHILKTVISERVAFVHATNRGLTVFETKDDPRAGWEIGSLFQEIIDGKAQT
jgi:chromosome partitioning protein